MRDIIIGDIHGCSAALRYLLAKIMPDEKEDRLILLGDLFDRGPDSWGVYMMVRELADRYKDRFVLLRGNHEDYLLQAHLTFPQRLMWDRVGRGTTVKSFKAHGMKMEESAPWIRDHVVFCYRGDGFQCVHAGLLVTPIEVNDARTLVHDHEITLRNMYRERLTVVGHIALKAPTWFAGDGETAEELPEGVLTDLPDRGVICIDTGCGKGGTLTAMETDGQRFTLRSAPEA